MEALGKHSWITWSSGPKARNPVPMSVTGAEALAAARFASFVPPFTVPRRWALGSAYGGRRNRQILDRIGTCPLLEAT